MCTVLGIWLNVNEKMKVYKIRFQKDILIWSKFHLMKTDLVLFLSFYVLLRMDLWMAAIRRVLRQKRRHWFRAKRMNSMILLTRVMLFKHKRHSMAFIFTFFIMKTLLIILSSIICKNFAIVIAVTVVIYEETVLL